MFDNLTPVVNVNSRTNYDLRYSQKTGKFNISQSAFNRLSLEDNGFKLFKNHDGTPVLQKVPNDDADIYSGTQGRNKSLTFTANTLAEMLGTGSDMEFRMEETLYNGNYYITLTSLNDVDEEASSIIEESSSEESTESYESFSLEV
jgi:hypothetical protein